MEKDTGTMASKSTTRATGLLLATLCAGLLMSSNAAAQEIPDEAMDLGESVYRSRCVVCHGEAGEGGQGPPLAINSRLGDERMLITQVLQGTEYMQAFAFLLSDAEIAAVATYIRNSWGNDHGPVAEEQVAEMR